MYRMPPDPRRRDQYLRKLDQLAAEPPFTVYGLAAPRLEPGFLAESQTENEVLVTVKLMYGDWEPPGHPLVAVTTQPPGSAEWPYDLPQALAAESKIPRGGWDPVYSALPQGELCHLGETWALRVVVDGQAVTVVGRGVDPAEVQVAPVGDLRPYVAERHALFERKLADRQARPEPVLAPARGIAAVRALLETFVPGGPAAGERHQALWRRAVAELNAVRGCGPERAEYLVTSMVNQLGHLRSKVGWYTERDGPREAALEELLRHVGLGEPVDSAPAQVRWERYWSAQLQVTDAHSGDLLADWARAWERWERERREPPGPLSPR